MKKRVAFWTVVAVAVLIGVLVVVFVPGREQVTLTRLQYLRWPHGALLRLNNNTSKTISYITDQGEGPTLFLRKTESGWTNTSLPIMSVGVWDPKRGKSAQIYVFDYPGSSLKVGDRVEVARTRELKPGRGAEIYVGLEPDGLPVRVGIMCFVPQGPVSQRLGKWVDWLKQRCRVRTRPPGEIEVWCSEPLQVSARPTRAERE